MRSPSKHLSNVEGTILVFALFIVLVGAMVLVGWAQMLATASVYPDNASEGVKNRIALENARALARQFLLTELPSGTNANITAALTDDWGGFSINASIGFWTNTNYVAGNPFSPFGDYCFAVTNLATLSNSSQSLGWRFFIKSRNPLLANYPLVVHQTASTNLTETWVPTKKIYHTETLGVSGSPRIPFTSGTTASGSGTNGYLGYFASPLSVISATNAEGIAVTGLSTTNFVTNGATFVNSTSNTNTKTYTTNYSGGRLTLVLSSTQGASILRYDVPNTVTNMFSFTNTSGPNKYIRNYSNAFVTNLTIVGSTNTNALHLVVPSTTTNITILTLSGTNNARRIYLNKQSSVSLNLRTATTNSSYQWWFGGTFSNAALTITAPSGSGRSLTITNGFRSDQSITLSSGNLNIAPVPSASTTNLYPLEVIADRVLWIEDGRNRSP